MYNAIFLRDSYLLLPAEFPSFDAFLADLQSRTLPAVYHCVPLLENNRIRCGAALHGQCMAPVFLSDVPDVPLPVTIHSADEVCPAAVERIPMAEYDDRLREVVRRVCPGCSGYTPIGDSRESLQGHHGEISLDGLCFFRRETAEALMELGDGLGALAWSFLSGGLWSRRLTDIRHAIMDFTRLSIPRARRAEDLDGTHMLQLRLAAGDLLAPFVLAAADAVVSRCADCACRLLPVDAPDITPDDLLKAENRAALRQACLLHGCAAAEIRWDGLDSWRIPESLERMARQNLIHILHMTADRAVLLVLREAETMLALRYRTPLMQRHGAVCTVHRSADSRRYTISYAMPCETIENQ